MPVSRHSFTTEGETSWSFATPSYVPTRVSFGLGALAAFPDILASVARRTGARRLLLVTGRRSRAKPWQGVVRNCLAEYPHEIIENTISNPTFDSIGAILAAARRSGTELVIGLGGGSVLDTAKAVGALAPQKIGLRDALTQRDRTITGLPVIAIPTTAGTGAEVTPFATVWDDISKTKHSLAGDDIYPVAAIVDPALTESMPPAIAAGTGLDALAHGIESSWSVNATDESIRHGIAAVALINDHLETVTRHPFDAARRTPVARASLHAGLSIARGQTTIAHAISYPLTARFGVHHGHACALSLGALTSFNAAISADDCQDPRGPAHVRSVLQRIFTALRVSDEEAAERRVLSLIRRVRLRLLSDVPHVDLGVVAADVMTYGRFRNNPRAMQRDQLDALLSSLRVQA